MLSRAEEGGQALAVVHRFQDRTEPIRIPLGAGEDRRIGGLLKDSATRVDVIPDTLVITDMPAFSAAVVYMQAGSD